MQFHPEVTYAMMCKWTTTAATRMALPGARPRGGHLEGWFTHDGAVARWTDAFLRSWITGGALEARPPRVTPVEHALTPASLEHVSA